MNKIAEWIEMNNEVTCLHLPDHDNDYWQAWVNGVQGDGFSRDEAIINAYYRRLHQEEGQ